MQGAEPVSQLVVIGASAGGVEALPTVLSKLPPEFPAPIVIAQHLDRTRVSHLPAILGRSSALPVELVTDQRPLRPGVIYVVPANRHVEITDHHVGVADSDDARPRPSVDLLLASAARVFGENLYAIVLTGTGSDGADGARQVKEAGGTVIIQNPRTASFPGMPLSLAPSTVDIVAELEAIGPLLHDLISGAYTPATPDEDRRMRALLEQLRARSGIDFSSYRQPTIRRRLQRRMADTGKDSLEAYARYLQRHPEEYDRLANSFLIKVTDFFRDADLFDYLRERVAPELIEEARSANNELRIWSAGCATGEEAYSLAIVVAEVLGDELDDFNVRIYATDADPEAVTHARQGIYSASALTGVPPELVGRYFTARDGVFEIKKLVRRLVVFAPHDLGQRAPFPRIDLALCRNVLIYFTPELQRRALQLFAFSLRPGGRLVLGKSETTSLLPEFFALEHPRLKIYRRQGNRVLIPPAQIRDTTPGRELLTTVRPELARIETALTRGQQGRPHQSVGNEVTERLLIELPIGVVVVDRHYDVQAINAAARRLLSIHTAAVGEDLIHLARRAPAAPLRAAIDRALRGQGSTERHEVGSLGSAGPRVLEIGCFPQPHDPAGVAVERVALIISDVTPTTEEPPPADAEYAARRAAIERLAERLDRSAEQQPDGDELRRLLTEARDLLEADLAELERLSALVRELDDARGELLAANHELTAANAELRTQNEELLIANQEAQAAVEEVETLSEEQQATNEELETLNEELQATVEELNTTNDDLEARGLELQESAAGLESERSRLATVLASMADGVLVIGRDGQPILTNAAFEQYFGSAAASFVPDDEQGRPLPRDSWPQRRAARGETFRMRFTLPDDDGARRAFEANGQPIQDDGHGGAVVVFRELADHPPP